ncbi:MAG: 1-acyl-sn-glycerol-3-phosphate acyltransferase [Spirochaetales bacterium]
MKPEVLGPILEVFDAPGGDTVDDKPEKITPATVFQPGKPKKRALINRILDQLVLPGSGITNIEAFEELYRLSQGGVPCLILMEHYSNFDIPCLYYLLQKERKPQIADHITAMAGMKLNEESTFVNAFAEAYTRVVIYPSRSLAGITDPDERKQQEARSREINMAATRSMIRIKHEGEMILVFPSGTRYREGEPDTKRGVKEVDSYMKSFEYVVFVGIAGNVLRIHPTGDMARDLATRDVVTLTVSDVVSCREFRDSARENPCSDDLKQCVADAVMERLEHLHEQAEAIRAKQL